MRILHVLSSTNVNSGIANFIMNYYRKIDKTKVQFDFYVFTDVSVNYNKEIESYGGKVYYFTKPGFASYLNAIRDMKQFFAEHKNEYDIIHCHEILVAKQIFKAARKSNKNIVCVSHSHSSKLSDSYIKAIRNKLLVLGLMGTCDYCFACSKLAAICAYGKKVLKSEKYRLVYNAIDLSKYYFNEELRLKKRKELNVENDLVLGNVGRLDSNKNQLFAVKVLLSALKSTQNIKLILVGDGGDRAFLEKYVIDNGISDKVKFLGIRYDVDEILNAFDYFIFPSKHEGFGISLVEAQANGLRCLCYDDLPEEIFISEYIKAFDKKSLPEEWAKEIMSNDGKSYDRKEGYKQIKEAGFDTIDCAIKLTETYFEISKGKR